MNLTETMSKFRIAQQMQNLSKENFEELEITMYKEIFSGKLIVLFSGDVENVQKGSAVSLLSMKDKKSANALFAFTEAKEIKPLDNLIPETFRTEGSYKMFEVDFYNLKDMLLNSQNDYITINPATQNIKLDLKAFSFIEIINQNLDKATILYDKYLLALEDDEIIQYDLAYALENAIDIKEDLQNALLWYRAADKNGNIEATYRLARHFLKGDLAAQKLGFDFLKKAALAKHANAEYAYGYYLENGILCEPNHELALTFYKNAAKQGHQKAIEKINEDN